MINGFYFIPVVLFVVAVIIYFVYKNLNTNVKSIDEMIGERCIVTEKIDNFAGCGEARVNGLVWSARGAIEGDVFEAGESLTVVAVEGVKLICKK